MWFLWDNKVRNVQINTIAINIHPLGNRIRYGYSLIPSAPVEWIKLTENELFPSKEELLKSL